MGILSREDLSHELLARAAQSYRPIIFDLQVRQLLSQLQRTHHHQFHGFPTSHLPPPRTYGIRQEDGCWNHAMKAGRTNPVFMLLVIYMPLKTHYG